MKKQTSRKKLTLSKETLRELTDLESRGILGGYTNANSGDTTWTETCTASRIFTCTGC